MWSLQRVCSTLGVCVNFVLPALRALSVRILYKHHFCFVLPHSRICWNSHVPFLVCNSSVCWSDLLCLTVSCGRVCHEWGCYCNVYSAEGIEPLSHEVLELCHFCSAIKGHDEKGFCKMSTEDVYSKYCMSRACTHHTLCYSFNLYQQQVKLSYLLQVRCANIRLEWVRGTFVFYLGLQLKIIFNQSNRNTIRVCCRSGFNPYEFRF